MRKKNKSHILGQLSAVAGKNPVQTVLLGLCMAASVLCALLPPLVLKRIIDNCLVPGRSEHLFLLAVLYLAASVLGAAAQFGQGYFLSVLGESYVHRVRSDMMNKWNKVPVEHFSRESDGTITGRFVNDVENVGSLISDGILSLLTDLLKVAGILVSIFLFSWKMGLLTVALAAGVLALTRLFQTLTLKAQEKNLAQMGGMNGSLNEAVSMAQTIKVYNREKWMQGRYRKQLEGNYRTNASIYFFDASYSPLVQAIRAVVITLIAVLASGHIGVISLSAGAAAASIDLITRLFDPINALGMEFQNIQKGISGIRRIDEFLDLEEEAEKTRTLNASEMTGDVNFDQVTYAYEDGPEVIKDFSLHLTKGDIVTIMGRTGAGKTTLIGLLTGLLSPQKGRVTIGGVDIRQITDLQKRQIFGYVQQDFVMVPGTVFDQVTMKDPSVTEEMALQAIGLVDLIDDLQALPDGLETDMEKAELSQGQKMLLQIARAIAPGSHILIFDESTASLDSMTEKKVDEALSKAAGGRIMIIISHRANAESVRGKRISL